MYEVCSQEKSSGKQQCHAKQVFANLYLCQRSIPDCIHAIPAGSGATYSFCMRPECAG